MRKNNIHVLGMQEMRMHRQVVHSFKKETDLNKAIKAHLKGSDPDVRKISFFNLKKANPYNERAAGGKTTFTLEPRFHIVQDKEKNVFLVKKLKEVRYLEGLIYLKDIIGSGEKSFGVNFHRTSSRC